VHTDAHLQLHAILRRQPPVDVRHGELHAEGAGDRLRRVVVTGDRGTKDDEDRITDDLVDGAIVPTDDVHHRLEVETAPPVAARVTISCRNGSSGRASMIGRISGRSMNLPFNVR
jgi:hypothetical protein